MAKIKPVRFSTIIIAVSAVERIAGLFFTRLNLFLPLWGIIVFLRHREFAGISISLLFLSGITVSSVLVNGADPLNILRSAQLFMMVIAFNCLVLYCNSNDIFRPFFWVAWFMIFVFIIELLVKSDLRNAYLSLDISWFLASGGTTFEDGLQLIAQGNVYAAAISGICAIVCGARKRYVLAGICLFFAISTGSRAFFISITLCFLILVLHRLSPRLRQLAVKCFVTGLVLQPIFYLNIEALLSSSMNEYLYSLSPRYVAFIAYSKMGIENILGVGYYSGVHNVEYFFARWPIPAHNMFVAFFGEVGIFGYIAFCVFVIQMAIVSSKNLLSSVIFAFTMTMYCFINGFNEWTFWVPLAVSYIHQMEQEYCSGASVQPMNALARRGVVGS